MKYISTFLFVTVLLLSTSYSLMAQVRIDSLTKITNPEYAYPNWSPDGKQIVYESLNTGNWEIYIMNKNGSNIRRLTDNDLLDRMPAWSPDGKHIVFISNENENYDVLRMDIDGSNRINLTNTDTHEIHPFWSPNSDKIIYNSLVREKRVYDVRVMNKDGSNQEVVLLDDDLNSYAQFSPSGEEVVFDKWYENNNQNGEIFLMDIVGNNLYRITKNAIYDGYPTWFPDSQTILYAAEVDSLFKLFSISKDGTGKKQLTDGLYHERRANVSKDGSQVAFNREIDRSINIYSYQINKQGRSNYSDVVLDSLQKITNPEFAYPHWSPDGKKIVYQSNVTGSWEIYKMNASGSNIQQLTQNTGNSINPSWSPDGSSIAFVSDRDGDYEIFMMDTVGANLEQLTQNKVRDIHPYWSPDSRRIIYNSSGDDNKLAIRTLEIEGGDVETLLEDEFVNSYASFSPDGSKIAYVKWLNDGQNGELYVMDLESRNERRLTKTPAFNGYPSWSPDGEKLVYASVIDKQFKIFIIGSDGIGRQQLTSGNGMDARPNWSPDGSKILFNRAIDGSIEIFMLHLSQSAANIPEQ